MLLQEYIDSRFSDSQKLIFQKCLAEAKKSPSTQKYLEGMVTILEREMLKFWGESLPKYEAVKLGFSPRWSTIDFDWDLNFDGVFDAKVSCFGWLLKKSRLDIVLLNFMLGLKLPSRIEDRNDRVKIGTAIYCAAIVAKDKSSRYTWA